MYSLNRVLGFGLVSLVPYLGDALGVVGIKKGSERKVSHKTYYVLSHQVFTPPGHTRGTMRSWKST